MIKQRKHNGRIQVELMLVSRYLDRVVVGKMTRGKTFASFLVFVLKIPYMNTNLDKEKSFILKPEVFKSI